MTTTEQTRVTDDSGVEFTLGEQLGRSGAQGTVYRVAGHPDYAIKLLTRVEDVRQIEHVRRLPLDGLPVAAPLTLIRNGGTGYLMRLAGDMVPLADVYLPRDFARPRGTAEWYANTGGLRRRLAVAAQMAAGVAALHERGLAYVDLNPNNVMVSSDLKRDETWLIDTDNLTSRSAPDWSVLGFPWYVAPERVTRGCPPSTLADSYILGVHAFRMLVMRHPLDGTAVADRDGEEARQLVDRGEVAYVADPEDTSNPLPKRSVSRGIFDAVLSSRLQRLARQTFGPGRLDPLQRPGSARWRDALCGALDNVIPCASDSCAWTYYRHAATCPSCGDATPELTVASIHPHLSERPLPTRDVVTLDRAGATRLLPRHLWGSHTEREPVVTLVTTSARIAITTHDDAQVLDNQGRALAEVPRPAAGQRLRVLVEAPGRPTRQLVLTGTPPR